jgi:hypothetical protein
MASAPDEGPSSSSPRVIWDKRRNPTKHVSEVLRIARWQLRGAIHRIKARSNLGAQDRIVIHSDGSVKDDGGAEIGNILDEL